MRGIGLFVLMLSAPSFAVDYTPWPDRPPDKTPQIEWARQAQGQACCKHCTKGQPCGNTCISAKSKCKSPPGCAC